MNGEIMDTWVPVAVTSLSTVLASSGLWTWLQKKNNNSTATNRLLMGLAYDKITNRGMDYIQRGWISKDEFEDFQKYLYEPYKDFGGNGVAERIMDEVRRLPLRSVEDIAYSRIVEAKLEVKETHRAVE